MTRAPFVQFEFLDPLARGLTDIGWEWYPEGFGQILRQLKRYERPVWITENGLDDRTGLRRPQYLYEHWRELLLARADGVDVRSYLHWSLMDNFEWLEAWGPAFRALPGRSQNHGAPMDCGLRVLPHGGHHAAIDGPGTLRAEVRRMMLATVLIDPPTTLFAGGILALISWKLVKTRGLDEVWRVGAALGGVGPGLRRSRSAGTSSSAPTGCSSTRSTPRRCRWCRCTSLFLFLCATWGAIGGLTVATLVHLKKPAMAWRAFGAGILGWAFFLFITLDQYKHIGTTREYLAGTAKLITDDPNWVMASNVSPVIFGLAAVGIIVLQVRRMRAP